MCDTKVLRIFMCYKKVLKIFMCYTKVLNRGKSDLLLKPYFPKPPKDISVMVSLWDIGIKDTNHWFSTNMSSDNDVDGLEL